MVGMGPSVLDAVLKGWRGKDETLFDARVEHKGSNSLEKEDGQSYLPL